MRNQISLRLYILSVLCLVACSGNNDKTNYITYTGFPDEIELKSQVIRLDTVLFHYPFRITVKDSVVLVMDLHNIDNFLHAFHYPDWKHLISFGHRGESPDEMLSSFVFHFSSPDSIWSLDTYKMEINCWNLSYPYKTIQRVKQIPLNKELVRVLDFYPMDSTFIVPDYMGKYRYNEISLQGDLISSHGTIPSNKSYKEAIKPVLAQAWRSFIDYNPKNGIFVMATQLGEVMEIYNLQTSTHKVIKGPFGDPVFKVSDNHSIPAGIMGYSDIKVTDNYIYAVFHGRNLKDLTQRFLNGENPEDGGQFIHVFDFEGNPIRKYILDRFIYGIDVNEEKGIITATDVNHDEPIIQFNI